LVESSFFFLINWKAKAFKNERRKERMDRRRLKQAGKISRSIEGTEIEATK